MPDDQDCPGGALGNPEKPPAETCADFTPRARGTVLLATARRPLVAWLRAVLAAAGLSLSVSPDGLHALMSAVRNPPEIIIVDDDLPGVGADRLEQLLARDERTAGSRVVHINSPEV